MIAERQVTILNTLGLHVRPSAAIAGTASKFKCAVTVIKANTVRPAVSRPIQDAIAHLRKSS